MNTRRLGKYPEGPLKSDEQDKWMRLIARAALAAAATIPLAVAAPAGASAATSTDVTYAFTVSGSAVSNTITNNSGTVLTCATMLGDAPGGVLPPVGDVIAAGQTLGVSGEIQPGQTTQTVTDVPDGSYVALATCSRRDGSDPAMWVSAYPGVEEYLEYFGLDAFTVEQASAVVAVPAPPAAGGGLDLGAIFGS